MTKLFSRLTTLAAILLFLAFFIWLFSLHGALAVFRVNSVFRWAFIALGFIGVIFLALLFIRYRHERNKHQIMNRWLSILIIILTGFLIIIPLAGFTYISGFPSPGQVDSPPQLLLTEKTGMYGLPNLAVVAYTEKTVTKNLSWGTDFRESIIYEEQASKVHVFHLSDLLPGTSYHYRIDDGSVFRFKTPDLTDGSISFAVGSDAHFGATDNRKDITLRIAEQISNTENELHCFFSLGDLVEYGFRQEQWNDAFHNLYPALSSVPGGFAAGNHDTLFVGTNRYNSYFFPSGNTPQSSATPWHRIDIGNVHFLILDLEWSAETFNNNQSAWLEEQLRSIPDNDWKVVLSHGFYYASGSVINGWAWYDNPETIQRVTPLFEKYGVDLVFSGHNHQLEYLQNSGIGYVICGGLGGIPDPPRSYPSPFSQWYAAGQYGFVTVTLTDQDAQLVFRGPDYEPLKSFTFPK